jgi:hypothetical protein
MISKLFQASNDSEITAWLEGIVQDLLSGAATSLISSFIDFFADLFIDLFGDSNGEVDGKGKSRIISDIRNANNNS